MADNVLDPADKFGTVEKDIRIGSVQAVADLIRVKTEVHGNGNGAGLHDTEINRQPFQAVHQQDRALLSLADPTFYQHVGDPVGLFIKNRPGNGSPVKGSRRGLDQLIFLPGNSLFLPDFRIDLYQGDFLPVELTVSLQQICNRHFFSPSLLYFFAAGQRSDTGRL